MAFLSADIALETSRRVIASIGAPSSNFGCPVCLSAIRTFKIEMKCANSELANMQFFQTIRIYKENAIKEIVARCVITTNLTRSIQSSHLSWDTVRFVARSTFEIIDDTVTYHPVFIIGLDAYNRSAYCASGCTDSIDCNQHVPLIFVFGHDSSPIEDHYRNRGQFTSTFE